MPDPQTAALDTGMIMMLLPGVCILGAIYAASQLHACSQRQPGAAVEPVKRRSHGIQLQARSSLLDTQGSLLFAWRVRRALRP